MLYVWELLRINKHPLSLKFTPYFLISYLPLRIYSQYSIIVQCIEQLKYQYYNLITLYMALFIMNLYFIYKMVLLIVRKWNVLVVDINFVILMDIFKSTINILLILYLEEIRNVVIKILLWDSFFYNPISIIYHNNVTPYTEYIDLISILCKMLHMRNITGLTNWEPVYIVPLIFVSPITFSKNIKIILFFTMFIYSTYNHYIYAHLLYILGYIIWMFNSNYILLHLCVWIADYLTLFY